MRPTKLLFAIGVFLVANFFLSFAGNNTFFINSFTSFLVPPVAYAIAFPDCGIDPPGSFCAAAPGPGQCPGIDLGVPPNISCRGGNPGTNVTHCCAKTCPVSVTCSGWTYGYNECSANDDFQTCTQTNIDCSTTSWTNYMTTDNCVGPRYTCIAGTCTPWYSLTGTVTDPLNGGGVGGISVSAGGQRTSTNGGGGYGFYYAFLAGCYTVSIGLPSNYIPWGGPTSQGFCVGGDQVRNFTITRVFSISGRVYDPANGQGIPGITVSVAGHTTTTDGGGNYTFPYSDHIIRGSYTVTAAVPTCWHGLTTSRGVTVGPDQTGIDLTMTKQYTIAGTVYDPYNGNQGKSGVAVHVIGKTTTTDGAGNYFFSCAFDILSGTHTVSITVPTDYTNTTPTSQNVTVGPNWTNNATGIDFGVTELFDVSGNIFVDPNINKVKDSGENNYPSTPQMSFTSRILGVAGFTQPTITTNPDGSYFIHNVITGPVTVNYLSLPAGYYMTSPLNGPPPSFRVDSGFGCSTNGAPGATCTAGNITNLNYGIINYKPWFQSTCGDIRNDNGITDKVPRGFYAIINNGTCSTPLAYSGDTTADFTPGTVSTTGQIVGSNNYPESYSFPSTTLSTSYTSLLAKAQNASINPTNICPSSPCSLSNNLTHGVYLINHDVTLTSSTNSYTFPASSNYVILVNGSLTINEAIHVPNGSTALFATLRDITVGPNVGTGPGLNTTDLEGWYVAGRSFIVTSQNLDPLVRNCNDLRLNVAGAVVVNSLGTGGAFQNNRDMCRYNAIDPTVTFQQRLDMILNSPQFIKQVQTVSQEIAP